MTSRHEKGKEKRAAQEEMASKIPIRLCYSILAVLMSLGSNRHALMRWLVPKSDESHEKSLKLWAPGMGKWLIEHADFISTVRIRLTNFASFLSWIVGTPFFFFFFFFAASYFIADPDGNLAF